MEPAQYHLPQQGALLHGSDPAPVALFNASGRAPFLLTGDHAGKAIPATLGNLGLSPADRERHIAQDIGIAALGHALATRLDAPFLYQPYSRLVIDCNRDPASAEAMPAVSDGTAIPANAALDSQARTRRIAEIHTPYHAAIAATLDARAAAAIAAPTILIALHSFTPSLAGQARPWHIGVLHGAGDSLFARRLFITLSRDPALTVGDNQPYRLDATDYSIPHHAFPRALPYAEIEIRQDLIADSAGQQAWATRLAQALSETLAG